LNSTIKQITWSNRSYLRLCRLPKLESETVKERYIMDINEQHTKQMLVTTRTLSHMPFLEWEHLVALVL
jgi:hypothetical protein